jgi:hypothetical protein
MENMNKQQKIHPEKGGVGVRLKKARVLLQNMNLKKSGRNAHAKFSYYELSDFMPAVNDIFDQLDLISVFVMEPEKASLTISDADNLDDKIVFSMPMKESKIPGCTEIQCLGGAQTYMRRYLYLAALEITESDLLDAQTEVSQDRLTVDIDKITTVNELNKAYRWLSKTKEASWKTPLKEKSDSLGAYFDKNSNTFVAAHKSAAAEAMI